MRVKRKSFVSSAAAAVLAVGMVGGITATSYAADTPAISATTANAPQLTYYQINGNQFGIQSDEYKFSVSDDGAATVTSGEGESEQLPETATDSTGNVVDLLYATTSDGGLLISLADKPDGVATRGVAQCALGTVGGAGAAAVAGGLGGAAVGTVTLPVVGTVGAGVVGTVGGGVFGGMTGAAASCFND